MAELAHRPENVDGIVHLGYPVYFVTILGLWKVLGSIAVLAPRFPRLKEWAYAGIFFNMTGAAASHAVCRDATWHVAVTLTFAALSMVSWALRPQGSEKRQQSSHPKTRLWRCAIMKLMKVNVECYSGRKADERLVRFWLEGRQHLVKAVLDQWYDPEGIFYKVRADDGNLYILRQQTSTPDGTWDLVSFRRTG